MKTFWQAGRNALAHALSKIVSPAVSSASPTPRNGRQKAIGRIALTAAFFLAFGLAQAQAQTGGTTSTTTLTSSPNPSQVNQTVTFTATVTGPAGSQTPTGTVTFIDASNAADIATVQLVGGVARITRTFTETTTDVVEAQYNGDGTFTTSQSNAINQNVISGAATTTTLTASPNPSQVNQQVTFTAIVAPQSGGGTPTGTVGFVDSTAGTNIGTVTLTTVNGQQQATVTVSFTAVSTHTITATYTPDAASTGIFATSNSNAITQNVISGAQTTTTLSSSPNPSQVNQQVTLTAIVAPQSGGGTPTGSINFIDNSNAASLGTVTLTTVNGHQQATLTVSFASASTHLITATYGPDAASTGVFAPSNSNQITQNVISGAQTTTTLSSSPNPSQVNQQVTLTAIVAPQSGGGTPTGSVNFIDNSNAATLGTVTLTTVNGHQVATLTVSFATVSTHLISAGYSPDAASTGVFASSTSNQITQTVTNLNGTNTTLTSTPNPSAVGQAVTFTATVTATNGAAAPTGSVTFKDGSTTIGTVTLPASSTTSAQATFTDSALSAGSHSITAVYSGAATFTASTSAVLTQTVNNSTSDSVKLREMQVSTTPVVAQAWGATVSGAIGDAITAGLSGGTPQALSPNGTGFTYYFDGDPATQHGGESDADSLKRYLASPNGSANPNQARVDDDFAALGYAGAMPTKAPPAVGSAAPREWLAWISVRGTDYYRPTFGDDLKGEQIDMLAGLTRRITPDFVVGLFAGYETFDYTSQAFDGTLTGDGWTTGAYLGWRLAGSLRFDLGGAWSGLSADDTAGTANGSFTGTRWLTTAGLTGTYNWQSLLLAPRRASSRCGSMRMPTPTVSARCKTPATSRPAAPVSAPRWLTPWPGRARWRSRPMPASMPTITSRRTTRRWRA